MKILKTAVAVENKKINELGSRLPLDTSSFRMLVFFFLFARDKW